MEAVALTVAHDAVALVVLLGDGDAAALRVASAVVLPAPVTERDTVAEAVAHDAVGIDVAVKCAEPLTLAVGSEQVGLAVPLPHAVAPSDGDAAAEALALPPVAVALASEALGAAETVTCAVPVRLAVAESEPAWLAVPLPHAVAANVKEALAEAQALPLSQEREAMALITAEGDLPALAVMETVGVGVGGADREALAQAVGHDEAVVEVLALALSVARRLGVARNDPGCVNEGVWVTDWVAAAVPVSMDCVAPGVLEGALKEAVAMLECTVMLAGTEALPAAVLDDDGGVEAVKEPLAVRDWLLVALVEGQRLLLAEVVKRVGVGALVAELAKEGHEALPQ